MAAERARCITIRERVPKMSSMATTEITAISARACPLCLLVKKPFGFGDDSACWLFNVHLRSRSI